MIGDKGRGFVALDGFRGIAAIAVVAWHNSGFFRGRPAEAYLAVDFFFTLSGFVLAYAYGERLRSGMPFAQFMMLRLIRLYPLYILGFCLWLPLGVVGLILGNVTPSVFVVTTATSIAFLPTVLPGVLYPANLPAWSLFFELIANMWLGLFGARHSDLALCFLLVFAAIATITATTLSGGRSLWWLYLAVILRGPQSVSLAYSFTAGVLVYRLWRRHKPPLRFPAIVLRGILFATLAAKLPHAYEGIFAATATLLGFPAIVWVGASCRPGPLMAGICTWLGAVSYAIYAIHVPLLTLLARAAAKIPHIGISLPLWFYGISYIAIVVMFAYLAARLNRTAPAISECAADLQSNPTGTSVRNGVQLMGLTQYRELGDRGT